MNVKDIQNTVMTVVDKTALILLIAQSLEQRAPIERESK